MSKRKELQGPQRSSVETLDLLCGASEVSHEDLCRVVGRLLQRERTSAVKYVNEDAGPNGEIGLEDWS